MSDDLTVHYGVTYPDDPTDLVPLFTGRIVTKDDCP